MASVNECSDFASFEAVPDAVIVAGRDGSIVFANRHADRVFGYEKGKLIGLTIESLIPEGHRERHARLVGASPRRSSWPATATPAAPGCNDRSDKKVTLDDVNRIIYAPGGPANAQPPSSDT